MKSIAKKISAVFVSMAVTFQIFAGDMPWVLRAFAAVETVGPYLVTNGRRGIDYELESNILKVKTGIPLIIENVNKETASTVAIEIVADVNANITLAGVNIAPTNKAALFIDDNSKGNVTITIADGTTNTLKGDSGYAGLQKNGGYISENQGKLTIQSGTVGDGMLNATGGDGGAGIGGSKGRTGSTGSKASSKYDSGGTGGTGGTGGSASNITILNGIIKAIGGTDAAGIGGGAGGNGGTGGKGGDNGYCGDGGRGGDGGFAAYITISGGTVTAAGGLNAAGVGGGKPGIGGKGGENENLSKYNGDDGENGLSGYALEIFIKGGSVTATGGAGGAGIGGGGNNINAGSLNTTNTISGSAKNITITNGTVIAKGGSGGAGIGGGNGRSGSGKVYAGDGGSALDVVITGGVVTATGGSNAAGIGGGVGGNGDSCYIGGSGPYLTRAGNGGSASNISISCSTVIATGGSNAAGVGGGVGGTPKSSVSQNSSFYQGVNGDVSNVSITNGANVTATGSTNGSPGIGGTTCTNILIENSSVKATGGVYGSYYGAKIGTFATSTADGVFVCPKNENGDDLYLAVFANPNGNPILINGEEYPVTKHADDDTNVYVYLTEDWYTVTIDDVTKGYNAAIDAFMDLPEVTPPTAASGLVYNENPQTLLAAAGTTTGGEIKYSLEKRGTYSTDFPTGINAGTYTVWWKSEDDTYTYAGTNPVSIEVTIDKAKLNIGSEYTNTITATDITYEDSLADSTLDGTGPVAGHYEWKDDTIQPSVADSETTRFAVLFVPDDTNYISDPIGVTLKVNKKTFVFSAENKAAIIVGDLEYGEKLSTTTFAGYQPIAAGHYEWEDGDIIPPASVGVMVSYPLVFVPDDSVNYAVSAVGDMSVTVVKATPKFTAEQLASIVATAITYGQSLTDSTISGDKPIEGNFIWDDDSIQPSVADSEVTAYDIWFKPTDTNNYNDKALTVKLTVNKADPVVPSDIATMISATDLVYEQTLGDSTLSYVGSEPFSGSLAWKLPTFAPVVADSDTTEYGVTYIPVDTINYNTLDYTATVHVDKKAIVFTTEDKAAIIIGDIEYGQKISESVISGYVPAIGGTYFWDDGDIAPNKGTDSYLLKFTPSDIDNYEVVEVGNMSLTTTAATPKFTAEQLASIVASAIDYGQTLADSTISGDKPVDGNFIWVDTTIQPSVADSELTEYDVLFKPTDTENYKNKALKLTLKVNKVNPTVPADIADSITASAITFGQTLGNSSLSYTGSDGGFTGEFVWDTPAVSPAMSDSDTTVYGVTYRPVDTVNYNTLSYATTVHVNKAEAPAQLKDKVAVITATLGDTVTYDVAQMINLAGWDVVNVTVSDTNGLFAEIPTVLNKTLTAKLKSDAALRDKTGDVIITFSSRDYVDFDMTARISATKCDHTSTKNSVGASTATCTSTGYTGDTVCNNCGTIVKAGTVIPMKSHSRKIVNAVAATCESEGFSGDVYCRDCDVFLESGHNTSRTEHIEGAPVILVEPTELTLGVREYRCVICNQITRRESIEYVKPDDNSTNGSNGSNGSNNPTGGSDNTNGTDGSNGSNGGSNNANGTGGSNGANNNANPADREEMEANGWNYDTSILNYLIVSEAGSGIVDSEGNAVDEHGEHHYDYYREIEGQPGMYELYCSDCGEIHQAKLNVSSSGSGKNPDTGIPDKMAFVSIALVAGCGIFISSKRRNALDI